jgi:hypothetical protein
MNTEEEIRNNLRCLLITYGIRKVYTLFTDELNIMRADLESLGKAPKVEKKSDEPETSAVPGTEPKTYPSREEEKDKKKKHLEVVQKKKEELKASGVEPSTLLTLTNMKKWIEEDGYSYWKIAETTGNSDQEVSVIAKQFGLKSKVSLLAMARKN